MNGYTKDLPRALQRRFENYKISIEILSDFNEEGHDSEAFDRLQNGSPEDKDLYRNRKDEYPLVMKAFTLINELAENYEYSEGYYRQVP